MSRDYYSTGKRGTLDGVPIWRPKWFGDLGNDPEFIEATKPRDAYKAAYYAGGYRTVKDGIPCRLAGYVADWAPWMRRALFRGREREDYNGKPKDKELLAQAKALGLVKPPKPQEERAAA